MAVADKVFQIRLEEGLNLATCRKQQEKGWCVLACSFIRVSMPGEQARERKEKQACTRKDRRKERIKEGLDKKSNFEGSPPSRA